MGSQCRQSSLRLADAMALGLREAELTVEGEVGKLLCPPGRQTTPGHTPSDGLLQATPPASPLQTVIR